MRLFASAWMRLQASSIQASSRGINPKSTSLKDDLMFPSHVQAVIDDFLPRIKALAEGRYAISIGGSTGRQQIDQYSDIDFRLFCDTLLTDTDKLEQLQQELDVAIADMGQKGVVIDGYWTRFISDVNAQLDQWCQGHIVPEDLIWTVWGYHLPSDIYNQTI